MKKLMSIGLGLSLISGGLGSMLAQEKNEAANSGPPKVLVVMREFVKPGRAGSMHAKTESAFIHAFTTAKWPTHYLGMDSLSGPSRALFMTGYDSFADWEKDNLAMRKNATLAGAVDQAIIADGDVLSSMDSSVYFLREDLSLNDQAGKISEMRYMEITRFQAKPGHEQEFEDLAKAYVAGFKKSVPEAHWATYQSQYGADNGGVYVVITPLKSLAEVDRAQADFMKFVGAVGEGEMKKMGEMASSSMVSAQTNLFEFNPKMSYVPETWVSADSFWKP